MKITLVLTDRTRISGRHRVGDRHACVTVRCPNGCAPLDYEYPDVIAVSGVAPRNEYDTHYASAFALCCRKVIGSLEVKVETFFGIDEDKAALHGRCRVYG